MPLERYQSDLKNGVYNAWHAGSRNVLATMATGLGKSYTVGHIVLELAAPTVVIAHRTELVAQLSMSLAERGVRHALTLPSASIRRIASEHIRALGRSYYDERAHARVVSAPSVVDLDPSRAPWLAQARYWVTDECFVAGTMVDTPHGQKPIQDVRVGDVVLSYDESSGCPVFEPVLDVFVSPAPRTVASVSVRGEETICTPGHPYFTQRGWVDAGNLIAGDQVLQRPVHSVPNAHSGSSHAPELPVSENWSGVLRPGVRVPPSRPTAEIPGIGVGGDRVLVVSVRDGRERACAGVLPENREGVLLDCVFERVPSLRVFDNNVRNESEACVVSDEITQPHAQPRSEGADVRNASSDRARAKNSRGERQRPDSSGVVDAGSPSRARVRVELGGSDREAEGVGVSAALQNRPGEPRSEGRSGVGRPEPFFSETLGREEVQPFAWARVDSVTFLERGSAEQLVGGRWPDCVYNLHVGRTNTYTANGVVVHNCHHVLKTNLWGRVVEKMPNALGLGVTATPIRAEGAGLGSHADGVFDALIEGPQLGEGIDLGFLTPYRLVCSESDIEISNVPISDATGDFNQVKLRDAVHQSKTFVGDTVKLYRKYADGKAAIAFVVDIEEAGRLASEFKSAGIPAEAISSKTPTDLRNSIMRDFKERRLLVLVNVDLFGEGVDIPALEVVIMARHTASLSLFLQQAGRAMRLNVGRALRARWPTFSPEERRGHVAASVKPFALIIDQVGNVVRHGFPCKRRQWSLDRRERRSRSAPADAIPLTTCVGCLLPYERHLTECPHCGVAPKPPEAKDLGPKQVDGDMVLVDPKLMRVLESEVKRVDGPVLVPQGLSAPAAGALKRNHHERQLAQRDLRESIALWAGYYNQAGEADRTIHKRFFLTFQLPILEAMALGATEAGVLRGKIEKVMEGLK